MNKIAILYTTFQRPELAKRTIASIQSNLSYTTNLFIADQSSVKLEIDESHLYAFPLPFDCGLSYARNYLVYQAFVWGADYCLLTADSLEFIQPISDLNPIIDFMESDKNIGIVGLQDQNRVSWTWNIELIPGQYFNLTKAKEKVQFNNLELTKCQVVTNFFLAKTQCLLENKWDEQFKLLEHEDFFYRLSKTNWKVYSSDFYKANYIDEKPSEYKLMRDRMYHEFRKKLQDKYNIKDWIREEQ